MSLKKKHLSKVISPVSEFERIFTMLGGKFIDCMPTEQDSQRMLKLKKGAKRGMRVR